VGSCSSTSVSCSQVLPETRWENPEFPRVARVLKPWSFVEPPRELRNRFFDVSLFSELILSQKSAVLIALQLIQKFFQNLCEFTALKVNSALE
jgi:hypothetical protein